jgi:ribose-phosphate pyrophosphokinase
MGSDVILIAGTSNEPLAESVAAELEIPAAKRRLQRFPDGEVDLVIEADVRSADVYLVQSTSPPINDYLIEMLLLADACHRAGAKRITALMPYFGYARQDRRSRGIEPIGARLVADLIGASGIDRVVAIDLHSPANEAMFPVPVDHLTAVSVLAEAIRESAEEDSVIVSPDLGAVKLAERYSRLLGSR